MMPNGREARADGPRWRLCFALHTQKGEERRGVSLAPLLLFPVLLLPFLMLAFYHAMGRGENTFALLMAALQGLEKGEKENSEIASNPFSLFFCRLVP